MLEAFKTGLTTALTTINTNVNESAQPTTPTTESKPPTSSTESSSTVAAASKITAARPEGANAKLKAIREKAQRDEEESEFVPVIAEKLVIQKVTQQINTKGNTSAVYTKPSPLLTK